MKHRLIRALAALGILTAPLALTLAPDAKAGILPVEGIVDLSIAIVSPAAVAPGDDVTYSITVANSEVSLDATDVSVTGVLPEEFAVTDDGGCSVDEDNGFSCTVASLPRGSSSDIVITTQTSDSTPPGDHAAAVDVQPDPLEPAAYSVNNHAETSTEVTGDPDLTVSVESLPEVVAPAGSGVVYRITVGNDGNVPAEATAEGTLPEGFTYHGSLDDACSANGAEVTCPAGSVGPGETAVFDVQAMTSTTVGTYDFTVSFGDASDTVTTVVANEDGGGGHPAFVCGGCSLTYSDPVIGTATLFVPDEYVGVFVRLSTDDSTLDGKANDCGTLRGRPASCDEALSIVFDEEEADYRVEDETNPIRVTYTPVQAPCSGMSSSCAPIGYYDPSKDPEGPEGDPEPAPRCDGAGPGVNAGLGIATVGGAYHVCIDQSTKQGNVVTHVVLMRSNDPLLPPLNLG